MCFNITEKIKLLFAAALRYAKPLGHNSIFTKASGASGRWSCELQWDFSPHQRGLTSKHTWSIWVVDCRLRRCGAIPSLLTWLGSDLISGDLVFTFCGTIRSVRLNGFYGVTRKLITWLPDNDKPEGGERGRERESTYRVTKCQHIGKLNVVGIKWKCVRSTLHTHRVLQTAEQLQEKPRPTHTRHTQPESPSEVAKPQARQHI